MDVCFDPTAEGLHVMDCTAYFKPGKPPHIFGQHITDNSVQGGDAMCNTNINVLWNLDGIDTVAKSKNNFSARDQQKAKLVRCFQHVSGHPSNKTLIYSATTNGIRNSPIT